MTDEYENSVNSINDSILSKYSELIELLKQRKILKKVKLNSIERFPQDTYYLCDTYFQQFFGPLSKEPIRSGIEDIFYYYLFYLNFGSKKEELYELYLVHLAKGRYTFKSNLKMYPLTNMNTGFINTIIQDFINSSSKRSCPFAHQTKDNKKEFFDEVWKLMKEQYHPKLFEKFGGRPQITLYVKMCGNSEQKVSGEIALFHLGLFGKYKTGELNINS